MRSLLSKLWSFCTWPYRKWCALVNQVLSWTSRSRFFLVVPVGTAALLISSIVFMLCKAFGPGPQGGLERTNDGLKALLAALGLFFLINETVADLIKRRKKRSASTHKFQAVDPLDAAMTASGGNLDAIGSMDNIDLPRDGAEPDDVYRKRLIACLRSDEITPEV